MSAIKSALLLAFLVLLSQALVQQASPINNSQASYRSRRSLCNTFGGCGSKRSMTPTLAGTLLKPAAGSSGGLAGSAQARVRDSKDFSSYTTRSPNVELVSEALADLLDYVQTNENYRQGKYVVVVPSRYAEIVPKSHSILLEDAADDLQNFNGQE